MLVDRATKCFATAEGSLADRRNHSFAVSAFVMVSWVVKVLEAMMNREDSGFRAARVLEMWVPSMLETNQTRGPPERVRLKGFSHHEGPQVRAANADVNDVRDGLARVPLPLTAADALAKTSSSPGPC